MSYQEQSSLTSGHHHQISKCPQRGMFKLIDEPLKFGLLWIMHTVSPRSINGTKYRH